MDLTPDQWHTSTCSPYWSPLLSSGPLSEHQEGVGVKGLDWASALSLLMVFPTSGGGPHGLSLGFPLQCRDDKNALNS